MTINAMTVRDALQRANQAGRGSLSDLETLLKALAEGAVYDTYAGTPTANVTPKAKGSWLLDTSSNIWYRAKGVANTDWISIGEHGLTTAELTVLNVVAGTALVSKALVLDASGNILMPAAGVFGLSRAALAATGTTSADAAVIVTQVSLVTASDGAKGVALPEAAVTEGPILVVNTVATEFLKIWPVDSGNDQINGASANAHFQLAPGQAAWFTPTSATQWYTSAASSMLPPRPITTIAAAGSTSADATVIASEMVAVTAADDAKGVALPAAAAQSAIMVINTDPTNLLLVYPIDGGNDTINGQAEDLSVTLAPGQAAWFIATSATAWYCPGAALEATLTTEFGSGISVAAAVFKSSVERVGGIITTRILIDISDLESEAAENDIIGDDGAANCHLGKITAAQNGTIFSGTMRCMEVPTTGEPDIDLYAATASDGVEGAAVTGLAGQARLVDVAANWTLGLSKPLTALPAADTYLYFAVGEGSGPSAGTYGAGKFLIELLGYDA